MCAFQLLESLSANRKQIKKGFEAKESAATIHRVVTNPEILPSRPVSPSVDKLFG
jgi:hypothetical protein